MCIRLFLLSGILSVFCSLAFSAYAEDTGELDYRFTLVDQKKLPLRRVQRPLLMPLHYYEIYFDAEVTQVDPRTPWTQIGIGASYGISNDWEVGMLILPISFSAATDSGFSTPEFQLKYGLLKGVFEVSLDFSTILPIATEVTPMLKLNTRTHLGEWISLDLGAYARYEFVGGHSKFFAGAPAELRLQILDALSLSASVHVGLIDSVRQRYGGSGSAFIVYTHATKKVPFVDIGAGVKTETYVFSGRMLDDPNQVNYPGVAVFARFFVPEEPDYRPFEF